MPLSANSEHIHTKRLRLAIVRLFLLSVVVLPLPVLSANIDLQSDSPISTAGFFRLSWVLEDAENMQAVEYQLQSSRNADFTKAVEVYRGPDLARVISGKRDGDYYYRIRLIKPDQSVGPWSEATRVTVAHHSLARALMFFAAGAVIFFSLLIFILKKHRTTR